MPSRADIKCVVKKLKLFHYDLIKNTHMKYFYIAVSLGPDV